MGKRDIASSVRIEERPTDPDRPPLGQHWTRIVPAFILIALASYLLYPHGLETEGFSEGRVQFYAKQEGTIPKGTTVFFEGNAFTTAEHLNTSEALIARVLGITEDCPEVPPSTFLEHDGDQAVVARHCKVLGPGLVRGGRERLLGWHARSGTLMHGVQASLVIACALLMYSLYRLTRYIFLRRLTAAWLGLFVYYALNIERGFGLLWARDLAWLSSSGAAIADIATGVLILQALLYYPRRKEPVPREWLVSLPAVIVLALVVSVIRWLGGDGDVVVGALNCTAYLFAALIVEHRTVSGSNRRYLADSIYPRATRYLRLSGIAVFAIYGIIQAGSPLLHRPDTGPILFAAALVLKVATAMLFSALAFLFRSQDSEAKATLDNRKLAHALAEKDRAVRFGQLHGIVLRSISLVIDQKKTFREAALALLMHTMDSVGAKEGSFLILCEDYGPDCPYALDCRVSENAEYEIRVLRLDGKLPVLASLSRAVRGKHLVPVSFSATHGREISCWVALPAPDGAGILGLEATEASKEQLRDALELVLAREVRQLYDQARSALEREEELSMTLDAMKEIALQATFSHRCEIIGAPDTEPDAGAGKARSAGYSEGRSFLSLDISGAHGQVLGQITCHNKRDHNNQVVPYTRVDTHKLAAVADMVGLVLEQDRGARKLSNLLRRNVHELRAPLSGLRQHVRWFSRNLESVVHENRRIWRRKLDDAKSDVDTELRLIDNLDIFRGEVHDTPKMVNLFEDVLQKIGKQATDELARKEPSAKTSVKYVNRSLVLPLYTSQADLNQLFFNLVSNAVKYRKPVGDLVIIFEAELTPNHIIIHTKDWGIGVPSSLRARIFETGFRAPNAREVFGQGIGLGVVKELAQRIGAEVKLTSIKDPTTFSLYIPRNRL